jgi:non-heme chloroperoxidase
MVRSILIKIATPGVAIALCACAGAPRPRPPAAWIDPSPHRVTFVAVAPGVRLEVIDWGGRGQALVFLAGLQDVAHGFDAFAPQFTDRFHVLAITRRGYGASSQPATGYDIATRVADLAAVLDSQRLGPVVLVGHSIAGDELTAFAGLYPTRVSKLVYLDAAYDHAGLDRLLADFPKAPPPSANDSMSPVAFQAYVAATYGMLIPEAQIRATEVFGADGKLLRNVTPDSIDAEMLRGTGHPDYGVVRTPALAFYAVPDSAPSFFRYWGRMNDSTRTAARAWLGKLGAWEVQERSRFQRGVRQARLVMLPGANHYVFLSDRDQVAAEMRAFLDDRGANGESTRPRH